jgi:FkbM family methyltransferase
MKNIEILQQEISLDLILKTSTPHGVIHAGAYIGGASPIYLANGIKNVCWIEADPCTFETLKSNIPPGDVALNVAVCDKDGEVPFIVTNNGQSSSILPLKVHSDKYPSIVPVNHITVPGCRFDSLIDSGLIDISKYNFLLMDLQGAEYYALKGFEKWLHRIDHIIAEINYEEMYKGCMTIEDFDLYMENLGFEKMLATQCGDFGWGDAYYKRVKI